MTRSCSISFDWVPDDKTRYRILVENPAVLYDFPKGS